MHTSKYSIAKAAAEVQEDVHQKMTGTKVLRVGGNANSFPDEEWTPKVIMLLCSDLLQIILSCSCGRILLKT